MSTSSIQLTTAEPADGAAFPHGVVRLRYVSGTDAHRDWALALPPTHCNTWVVNLHGHGSHGDQLYVREDIRRDWFPGFRRRGLGILTPNLRDNAWMSPAAADDLHGLLELVRGRYGADRYVFVSGSMGGTGALIYAILHHEDVAGVAALCPATGVATLHRHCAETAGLGDLAAAITVAYGGTPDDAAETYDRHSALRHRDRLTMPVYLAHGSADAIIPVTHSRAMADAGTPGPLKYREIPGGHHDSPVASHVLEEAVDWVLPAAS